jgi:ribosomal protein S18 acetylase RimI-like enzyme
MQIRLMDAADYDKIHVLWQTTAGMGLRSLDDSREGIERFLKRNPTTSFVAVDDGQIVGTILCGHDGRRGFLYHTTVASPYRGRGVGRALVKNALDALHTEGIHKAALVTYQTNDAGNAFWTTLGWHERTDLCYRDFVLTQENR